MNQSNIHPDIIQTWLHSTTENNQIRFEVLMKKSQLPFTSADFKRIGSPVTNMVCIRDALNHYFEEIDYPFIKAYYKIGKPEGYIKSKIQLNLCPKEQTILIKESDLNEHRECFKHRYISKTEREKSSDDIFIKDDNPATKERERKKIEEERNIFLNP